MTNVIRFDSVKIPKVIKTKEGYLRGEAVVSRAGVFKYRNADGSVRGELRHPDEVFTHESLNTLKMIPVTLDHPPVFVDAENAHLYQVGFTGERYDVNEDKIIVSITVTHQDAINAILEDKQELSMGYYVDLTEEKGSYKGEEYEYRQSLPLYNHLAIVAKGRAGSEARFRFDSAGELIETENTINNFKEERQIMKEEIKIMDDENMSLRIDSLNSEINQLKSQRDLYKFQLDETQVKLDRIEKAWEKDRKELALEKETKLDSVIEQKVMDRTEIFYYASPYLKDISGFLRHSDRDVMIAAMNSSRIDSKDYGGASDDYVRGEFNFFVNADNKQSFDKKNVFGVIAEHYDRASNLSINDQLMKQFNVAGRG